MIKCGSVKLATGADLPLLVWSVNPAALTTALKTALDAGYRLIDTAYVYGNEAVIGKVSGEKQLRDLQVDYFDLYLIHCPCPCKHQPENTPDNYKPLLEDGRVVPELVDHLETWKAIGLSNFNEKQIQNVLDHATIKPHNLQIEAHLYWPQKELHELCKKNNITMTSYSTLGSSGRATFNPDFIWPTGEPMKDPLVLELAAKHKKSPAQACLNFEFVVVDILLRHMIQRGICVIPKSINADRILENCNIFDFILTEEEINQLNNVKTRFSIILGIRSMMSTDRI
ncbi:Oxidoreductase, aldo/keto reductase family protein [Dirofilaria immitis]|nr:Oxidoreductase, aldo/keto reductase family protein [Dirofilaria immitis]